MHGEERTVLSAKGATAPVCCRSGCFEAAGSAAGAALTVPNGLDGRESERRLGLWVLVKYLPASAIGLYRGIVSDEGLVREFCEAALVSIEPIYASYFPRLRERYRETAQAEEFDAYLAHLAMYLVLLSHEI